MTAACAVCGEPLGEDGLCAACLLGGALGPTVHSPATEAYTPAGGPNELIFDSFGPYTILRVLGEGGMGAVYQAEQFEPIRRMVAIKVIKPGLDSRSILSRFNYERQTLAMMNHPNIAQVYDASTTTKGRPYFVMEYIDGAPITDYCDRRRLNTRQRLSLFLPVCLAVHHAHSKGILHRDIKPSNVLVTEVDGTAIPKVIDFGIAKAADQQKHDQTALTQFGQFVGTPEYMSPEAADLVGGGVDTTSDVYSLGVLLYELLVGAVPFDGKALRKAGMSELLRVLREVDAPSLPAKLTSLGQTLAGIAESRASTPVTLRKEVGGELNLITLKAVEKDRTRRYDSVRAFSDDIERFLDSRPVKACPPTLSYRLSKYAAKNRGAVIAAAALLLAVTAGTATTLWQARTAIRERTIAMAQRSDAMAQRSEAMSQRSEAVQQRARAESEAAHASAEMRRATEQEQRAMSGQQDIRNLANSMLFQLDDQLKDTGSVAARTTLLNLGLQYLQKADASDPNLGAAYFRVAELQESLRDTDRAEDSYRRSATLLRQRLTTDPRDREARRLLACATLGLANLDHSYEGRSSKLKDAETQLRSLLATDPGNAAAMLDLSRLIVTDVTPWENNFGLPPAPQRNPEEAVNLAVKAIQSGIEKPAELVVLAQAQVRMSDWIVDQSNATEDILWARRAVTTLEGASRQAPSNTKVLISLSAAYENLARHHGARDEQDKAVSAAARAVEVARQAVAIDPQSPSTRIQLARSQGNPASYFSSNTNLEQFRVVAEEVTRLYRQQIADHPDVMQHRLDFAVWAVDQLRIEKNARNWREGLNQTRQGIEELRLVLKKRPDDLNARRFLAEFVSVAGQAHTELREYPQARALAEESVAIERALVERSHDFSDTLYLAVCEAYLSNTLAMMGQPLAGLEHIRAASAIVHRTRGAARSDRTVLAIYSQIQSGLASYYTNLRDTAGLRSAVEELSALSAARYAENPYDAVVTQALWQNLFHARTLYIRTGETDKVLANSRRSVEIARKVSVAYPGNLLRESLLDSARVNVAYDLMHAGLREEALAANREAAADVAAKLAGVSSQSVMLNRIDHAGFISRHFRELDEPGEGLRLGLQIIPAAEAIVAKDPQNRNAVENLLTSLFDASANAWENGSIAQARDLTAREIAVSVPAARTSKDLYTLATRQINFANLEEYLQNPSAAARERSAALENLAKSLAISERAIAESKGQSVAEWDNMRLVRRSEAFVREQLGQLAEARKAQEQGVEVTERIAAAQNSPANRDNQSGMRARLSRLLELTGASEADFQRLAGPDAPLTPERKQALLASGWRQVVLLYPVDPRKSVPAARRSVDLFRGLVREGSPVQQRIDLALALHTLAGEYRMRARLAPPSEQASHLENARRASRESVDLLEALRTAGTLPEINQSDWSSAKILLSSLESNLAAARGATVAPNR